jgi:hypothetical protein
MSFPNPEPVLVPTANITNSGSMVGIETNLMPREAQIKVEDSEDPTAIVGKALQDAATRMSMMKNQKLVPHSSLIRIRSGDGQLHIVTKSLLDQAPYFKAILSQRWAFPSKSEEIEVCCASESFTNLLNVLRYGQDAARDLSSSAKYMLLMDANYFGFPDVLFDKIHYPVQIARPCRKLPPVKVKAPVIL